MFLTYSVRRPSCATIQNVSPSRQSQTGVTRGQPVRRPGRLQERVAGGRDSQREGEPVERVDYGLLKPSDGGASHVAHFDSAPSYGASSPLRRSEERCCWT